MLVVLPQLLRTPAEAVGYALQPISVHARHLQALLDTLDMPTLPTVGHGITLDLTPVPLDEVLDSAVSTVPNTAHTSVISAFLFGILHHLTTMLESRHSRTVGRLLRTPQTSFGASPESLGGGPWPPLGSASLEAQSPLSPAIPSALHSVPPARSLASDAKRIPAAPTTTCSARKIG
ncbi:hypothetical protein [Actinokineospora fastidiosa]|uniref:hypothetical protein n=1 Tax=Actinokineospora fastidiosa TaxID=1816 RepID=UPI00167023FC|nr:hypothetical protein [Actinokineospora fastidiosa]